ncbi:MAG: hypothetical protein ACJ0DK_05535 [Planctomycetota bacterium]
MTTSPDKKWGSVSQAVACTITDPRSLDAAKHQAEMAAELFEYPATAIVLSLLMHTSAETEA